MILFSSLLFFYALNLSTAIIPLNFSQQLTDAEVLEKWNEIEKGINKLLQSAVKSVMPYVAGSELQLSSKCMNDGLRVLMGLRKVQPWALRFLDSSGKIISGMMTGTVSDFGSYEECVDTVLKNNHDEVLVKGQYCNIHLRPPMPPIDPNTKLGDIPPLLKNISEKSPLIEEIAKYSSSFNFMSFRLGICVPSGCEKEDVGKIFKYFGDMINFDTYVSRCEVKEEVKFAKEEIASFTIVSIFAALMIVGTLTDIYSTKMKVSFNSKAGRLLLAFSLLRNVKKLLMTQNSSGPFSCLNGIRFITTSWIVLSHSYYVLNYYSLTGLLKTMNLGKEIGFQIVMNGTFAVETFFCIGGLLVSYHIVSQSRRSINIPYYILHRIWRVLPMVAITIIGIFMTPHFSSGPIWYESFSSYLGDCKNNWWTNLIFINNFYRPEDSCLPHTWYIASDMQMYIAALIIYLPLLKRPKVGLALAFLALFASIIYCGVHTYVNDLPPTMLTVQPDPRQYKYFWNMLYFKPFAHVGPYCIGILLGYLLATKPNLKISRGVQVFGWCFAIVSSASTVFGTLKWNSGDDYNRTVETIAYASLSRAAWALGLAWTIVCCATGHGGIVNRILSWKVFVPLARLTFVVYLLHPIVQVGFIGSKTTLMQMDHFLVVWYFFGHLLVTFGLGVLVSMMFEVPFMNLEKILLSRPENRVESKPADIFKGTLQVDKNGSINTILTNVVKDHVPNDLQQQPNDTHNVGVHKL